MTSNVLLEAFINLYNSHDDLDFLNGFEDNSCKVKDDFSAPGDNYACPAYSGLDRYTTFLFVSIYQTCFDPTYNHNLSFNTDIDDCLLFSISDPVCFNDHSNYYGAAFNTRHFSTLHF